MNLWSPKDFKTKTFKSSTQSDSFTTFDFKDTAFFSVPRLFDSHVHLQGLGKYAGPCHLSQCSTSSQVKAQLTPLLKLQTASSPSPFYLEAFGLNLSDSEIQNLCSWAQSLSHSILSFVLDDGHRLLLTGDLIADKVSVILKTPEIQAVKEDLTFIYREEKLCGVISGDLARPVVESLLLLSQHSLNTQKLESELLLGQKLLLDQGFTHCRDMTSDLLQFQTLLDLEKSQRFWMYTDLYFSNFKGEPLEALMASAQKALQYNSARIQFKGIKIFLDGSLSGKNLDCSCSDLSPSPHTYKAEDIYEILSLAYQHQLEVAFHCIGDLAFEKIILALKTHAKHKSSLPVTHLEHCEFINTHSLKQLQELINMCPSVSTSGLLNFHFQPSHWIEDHTKCPLEAQHLHFFAWDKLTQMGFKNVFFGSDAPVVSPQFRLDQHASLLIDFLVQKKWPQAWWTHFIYPDFKRGALTFTLFESASTSNNFVPQPCKVFIDGHRIDI